MFCLQFKNNQFDFCTKKLQTSLYLVYPVYVIPISTIFMKIQHESNMNYYNNGFISPPLQLEKRRSKVLPKVKTIGGGFATEKCCAEDLNTSGYRM